MSNAIHLHHHLENLPVSATALEWAGFSAVFSYSFLVSFHCLGMCGPLACSLLGKSPLKAWKSTALYNIGRGVSYAGAGASAAALVSVLNGMWPFMTEIFAIGLGVLVSLWAIAGLLNVEKHLPALKLAFPISRFRAWLEGLHPALVAFGMGLFTIFLPCMTLHPLLFLSASQGSALTGAMTMLAFFAGTLPAMVSATYVPTLIPGRSLKGKFTKIGHFLLLIAGIITIWRGVAHH